MRHNFSQIASKKHRLKLTVHYGDWSGECQEAGRPTPDAHHFVGPNVWPSGTVFWIAVPS